MLSLSKHQHLNHNSKHPQEEFVVPEELFAFVRVAIFGWLALFSLNMAALFMLDFIRVYKEEGSGE
jgi:hypothetical protein